MFAAPPVGGLAVEPASAKCKNASGKPHKISRRQARNAITCLIDSRRASNGRGRVKRKVALRKVAGKHSRRVRRSGCFAHQCSGERDLAGRASASSYLPCRCSWGLGETIAWKRKGRATPRRVVRSWMTSGSHRSTLLTRSFEHVGIGVAWGRRGKGSSAYFTADFGYKR